MSTKLLDATLEETKMFEEKGMGVGEWKWRRTLDERLRKAPHFGPNALIESVVSGAIAPLRGRWLAKLWESNCKWVIGGSQDYVGHSQDGWIWHGNGGRVLRRQDLPSEAFFSPGELQRLVAALGDDYWVLFVALSHVWLSDSNPDPDGFRLRTVGEVARQYLGVQGIDDSRPHWLSPLVKAFVNADLPAGEADFALFWDVGALYQPPRTRREEALYQAGLVATSVWFGHAYTICWVTPEVPDVDAEALRAKGLAASYQDSGWAFAASAMAAIVKSDNRCLDLSLITERAGKICYSGYGNLSLDCVCGTPRMPPPSAAEMYQLLSEKHFHVPEDASLLSSLYETFLAALCRIVPSLSFHAIEAKGGQRLTETLTSFTQLTSLDVSIGPGLEGRALQRLAHAIVGHSAIETFGPLPLKDLRASSLTKLDLRHQPVGPLGALVLSMVFEASGCGTLYSIDISHAGLLDKGAAAIAAALQSAAHNKANSVSTLEIGHNGIGQGGVNAIAQLCEQCRTLHTLAIDEAIGRDGQATLAKAMKDRHLIWS